MSSTRQQKITGSSHLYEAVASRRKRQLWPWERRSPFPSDAPHEDWPCVVAGPGFATEQRIRRRNRRRAPLARALPSSTAQRMAAEAPVAARTSTLADVVFARHCVQGPHPPHTPGPDHLLSRQQASCLVILMTKHHQGPVCKGPPPPCTPRCQLACQSTQG